MLQPTQHTCAVKQSYQISGLNIDEWPPCVKLFMTESLTVQRVEVVQSVRHCSNRFFLENQPVISIAKSEGKRKQTQLARGFLKMGFCSFQTLQRHSNLEQDK
jgi:hypothetical protein